MVFGYAVFVFGYALFYWGLHHFPQYQNERYSLWTLLGFGSFFASVNPPAGVPTQIKQ